MRTTLFTLVLTGLAYPLTVTGLAQLLFPSQANGSILKDPRGQPIGSELIGQSFHNSAYFHSRPSAAGENGYDAAASSGSNLGPTSKKLKDRALETVDGLRKANPEAHGPVPAELVTTSGSGLDPHLSPEAVRWQIERVARSRQVSAERILSVVNEQIEDRDWGFMGEPRINVLSLNLALDRQFGSP